MQKAAFLFLITAILLSGCTSDLEKKEIPDVSAIDAPLQINRFEQDLFSLDTNNLKTGLEGLEAEYPEFSEIYFNAVLRSKDPDYAPEGNEAYVRTFISDPSVRHLYDTTQVVFGNMDEVKADFVQALKYFRYWFPDVQAPEKLTTFISWFAMGGFIFGDNELAVGLDLYLGDTYPYWQIDPSNTAFSAYLTRTFNKQHMVVKSFQPLIDDMLGRQQGERLLDFMIHNGKKLYVLDLIAPNTPDSVRLEMTGLQVEWLRNNELEMWSHFLREDLLYSNDLSKIRKLIDYSPNSPGMPPEAPGRTANWVGWQIVKAYMRLHPETTPRELIGLKDAQVILDGSKYKPRR
ncbi:MAG TPA: hypothetical protein PKE06_09905 [Flavilitoribacter sp.]|nr:hypothetical protein [Flavilitoribacter sp.]HMQ90587.1 hypothetical protein [Flavilitoribacter sp.]